MSTNDHPDQETERTQLRVRHRELQPQVGRRGDLPATASGDVVSPAFTPYQERDFQDDKRESPGDVLVPSGTTSGRTSHMASLRVAARGAWPPHPQ